MEYDGSCRQCLEFTKPDTNRRLCITPLCDNQERVDMSGDCIRCPEGLKSDENKRNCVDNY